MVKIEIIKKDSNQIKIKFSYNQKIIEKIKTIPGRRWNPEEKCWTVPYNQTILDTLTSLFKNEELIFDPSLKGSFIEKNAPIIFTEVFPVQENVIPNFSAISLKTKAKKEQIIGGKLSYQLRTRFGGHWVWADYKIITDSPRNKGEIMELIEELWKNQSDVYKDLIDIVLEPNWKPSIYAIGQFVANGLLSDLDTNIKKILRKNSQDLGNALIEREFDKRGWQIDNKPAISISISSSLIYKYDLQTYVKTIKSPKDLIGLWVSDKTSTLKGEIVEIVGKLADHKTRLLDLTQREEMIDLIEKAPNDELVFGIMSGYGNREQYDYISSALNIVLRMEDLKRFNVDSQKVQKALLIDPTIRSEIIMNIFNVLKEKKIIDPAYNSKDFANNFLTALTIGFSPQLKFGTGVYEYNERNILRNLRDSGIYKVSDKFKNNNQINIAIINALGLTSIKDFLSNLKEELKQLNFKANFIDDIKISSTSRLDLEKAIEQAQRQNPHILLCFLPNEESEDSESWGPYYILKSLTIGKDLPSQVVYKSTIFNKYAMGNIILGIIGKTGNIPFVLAEPLSYADYVIGIDIAREKKKSLVGTMNATAITRIYLSDGGLLRYAIHDTPLEGETIPDDVLKSFFPANEFAGKRIIVHRDGFFRGNEKDALMQWGKKIGAQFFLVEVIKTGTPRIYLRQNDIIKTPEKGMAFKLNNSESFLVSSLPVFKQGTPQPLRIRTDSQLTIEQALNSVLSLTILHYGSLRPPKLPVTIHYSDRIAYLALRGIKPKSLEGNLPFWL